MKTANARPISCAGVLLLLISCGDSATPPEPVRPPPPTAPPLTVSVSPAEVTLSALDDTVRLTADVRDPAGQPISGASVIWSSGARSVAGVDGSGLVTALSNGTTMITARVARASANALVTVMQVPVGITVTPSRLEFDRIGSTARLTASHADANSHVIPGVDVAATWTSVDPSVAIVDSTGLVTAVDNGSTAVIVVSDSNAVTVSVTVSDASKDREALERLYRDAGGDAWTRNTNWLTGAPLSEWFGVRVGPNGRVDGLQLRSNGLKGSLPRELGDLENLTILLLNDNQLTGPIPPELGKLALLERLEAIRNQLSGPLPPELGGLLSLKTLILDANDLSGPLPWEIGNLVRLQRLGLTWNAGLSGLFPHSLLNLKELTQFWAFSTALCPPLDDGFRQWLDGIAEKGLNDCSPAHVESIVLSEFFDLTGGESWNNASGWNTDTDVGNWYGITAEGGRVRSLSMANNGLTGRLPRLIAGLTELESLDLSDNELTGQLPEDIGSMAALRTLRLNGNEGLEGFIPFTIRDLTQLEVLQYEGTGLCIPPTRGFETWLEGVAVVDGPLCENVEGVKLTFPMVYLTQAIQRPTGDVPLIAGRDALLRVFLMSAAPNAFYKPEVVATFSRGGEEVHRVTIALTDPLLPTFADQGDVRRSYNAVIPGDLIQPGLEFVVEADPEGAVPLTAGSQTRYPASGLAVVDVVEVPPMELTVVPVVEAAAPDSSIYRWTNGIGDDSRQVGLLRHAFPFAEFRARSRETYVTSRNLTTSEGQWRLVLELEGVRAIEGGTGYWYGAASSVSGYVRGRARLGGPVSMGKPTIAELAHEVGHNLNLPHAPCGNPLRVDPGFPHPGGGIGAWGYDFRDGSVVVPETRRDIMGYCYAQGWLSDYNFERVISHRDSVEADARPAASQPRSEVLVLWGGVVDGELRIEPAFRVPSTERLPDGPGPYRLEGFEDGVPEFSISFRPEEDQFGNKYFFFMIPSEALDRITLTGPEGTATIGVDDQRTVSVVRDPSSGRVRSILDDWNGDLPAVLGPVGGLDVATYRALGDERR